MDWDRQAEGQQEELVRAVRELVAFPSMAGEPEPGHPFGREVGLTLERALGIAQELGFRAVNLDGKVGYAESGEGAEYVAILGHLDVVPAGEGWTHDPFGGEIDHGFLYGRGTLDDKGPTLAALFGLKAVVQSGLPLSRRVRVIFGTCEETTWDDLPHYLKREPLPALGFTPDGNFPLIHAEKGHLLFSLAGSMGEASHTSRPRLISLEGGQVANMVPPAAKAVLENIRLEDVEDALAAYNRSQAVPIEASIQGTGLLLRAKGMAAHGSLPHLGRNAIMGLVGFLDGLALEPRGAAAFLSFLQHKVGMETDGASLGISCADEVSGALTLNMGVVSCDSGELKARFDLRYPVTAHSDDLLAGLQKSLDRTGFRLEGIHHTSPLYVPTEDPLVRTLLDVYRRQTGQEGVPLAIGGRTYATAMPHVVAFGPLFPGDPDLDHQADECISLERLRQLTAIYAHAIAELAR